MKWRKDKLRKKTTKKKSNELDFEIEPLLDEADFKELDLDFTELDLVCEELDKGIEALDLDIDFTELDNVLAELNQELDYSKGEIEK